MFLDPGNVVIGVSRGDNPSSTFKWYWIVTLGRTADPATCAASTLAPATTANTPNTAATGAASTTNAPTGDTGTTNAPTGDSTTGATVDTDGDGLLDTDETSTFGTDPNQADTDQGGVGDGAEVANGTNPLDGTDDIAVAQGIQPDPSLDTDGDGVNDVDEQAIGTDPLDPNSH